MAVFVTGASSGIGWAMAMAYAKRGHVVGVLSRRQEQLQDLIRQLPGDGHRLYAVDVRDRQALHDAAKDFEAQVGQVDLVLACAGVSAGTLTQTCADFEVFEEIMAVNVMATMATFEPFVAGMMTRGSGKLVGFASIAGVRGLPGAGAYCASKAAVRLYCESLRVEMSGTGVGVVTIVPGYVETEMTAVNPFAMPFLLSADAFARRCVRAIDQNRRYAVIPWQMAIVSRLMALLPGALYDRLARNAPRKPRRAQPGK